MGYERKRGKLAALNAFLRNRRTNDFSLIQGETTILSNVKYVITLDTDTSLPGEAARRMIEAMAHPLNHACYSAHKKRVTQGYGILQPRLATAMPGSPPTRGAQAVARPAVSRAGAQLSTSSRRADAQPNRAYRGER